ncbi:hypothetical protein CAMGR0001_0387 [Campylobacter gracilis RM3268]|uniref:Uncharacterized protein n=1 Tax=Campylobacter gracilis RM3268 TaxID=553220 RepID=C8PHE2_9BACT|nr:hypothetical protein CAMGR0001_0387 [Campylobacter gracilis RM3268]
MHKIYYVNWRSQILKLSSRIYCNLGILQHRKQQKRIILKFSS